MHGWPRDGQLQWVRGAIEGGLVSLLLGLAACGMDPPIEPSSGEAAQAIALTATYDTTLKAPACRSQASGCDSGTLVSGRSTLGPEPSTPNTIYSACWDGSLGSFHRDESLDRLVVSTIDGAPFTPGSTVRIDATVWVFSAASDRLDLYSAPDASNPVWTFLTTLTPPGGGLQTLSTTYVLPVGSLQAIRGQFRFGGSTGPCTSGGFNDRDDLAFAVVATDNPPTTAITAPAPDITVSVPTRIAATASDDLGIAKVEFYRDATVLIGTATSPPYLTTLNPFGLSNGAHLLTSKAYDTTGHTSVSAPVSVNVLDPDRGPPQVNVSYPNSPGMLLPRIATLQAHAIDDDDAIVSIEYYVDGALLGSASGATYSASWDTESVANGLHSFSARACDEAGHCVDSLVISAVVDNDFVPPTTTLTAPADGAVVNGTVTLTATAADNRAVDHLELYVDTTRIAYLVGAPYSRAWNSGTVPDGPHTLTSKVYDASLNSATSTVAISTRNLDTTPPTARLDAPTTGSIVSGFATLRATATDNLALARVEFYVDAGLVGTAAVAPYTLVWDSASAASGAHVISCAAYDGAGNRTDSAAVPVTVYLDTTPPTTSLTLPAPGATLSGVATLTAEATDDLAVTTVEFYRDGTILLEMVQGRPYAITWNTATTPNGTHTLTTKAYDAAGHSATSAPVTVTVTNTAAPPVTAVYDASLGAPRCGDVASSCSSGTLVDGRGPSELHAPDVIGPACPDGIAGAYHSDESLDRLKVSTADGFALSTGKRVRIDATVWAYSSYWFDSLDLYYAADAMNPTWQYIATLTPFQAGAQTLSTTYVLPSGSVQAIRGQYRYAGAPGTCESDPFDDRDDLVFAVLP